MRWKDRLQLSTNDNWQRWHSRVINGEGKILIGITGWLDLTYDLWVMENVISTIKESRKWNHHRFQLDSHILVVTSVGKKSLANLMGDLMKLGRKRKKWGDKKPCNSNPMLGIKNRKFINEVPLSCSSAFFVGFLSKVICANNQGIESHVTRPLTWD